MPNQTDITLKIAATGGDQASAEVRKLDAALGIVTASESELAAKRAGFLTAAEAEVAEVDRMVAASKKATAATEANTAATKRATEEKKKHAAASNQVSASMAQMRNGIQNTAFQVQDMAVQLEMGTSATRVFSQQVPQLLGGFGAIGAIAGAVIGIGLPLAAALLNTGKAAEDSSEKLDEYNAILDEHAEAVKKATAEKAGADMQSWFDSLDAEEQYYADINSRLERQIALQSQIRAAKESTASAKREAEIADIEADPKKSADEKIKEVAAIRERDARAKADAKKAELDEEARIAAAAAAAAQKAAERQAADAEAATKERERLEARAKELETARVAGAEAGVNIPKIEKELYEAQKTRGRAQVAAGAGGLTEKEAGEFSANEREIGRRLYEAKQAKDNLKAVMDEEIKIKAELENAKKNEPKQRDEAISASEASKTAFGKALTAEARAREVKPEIDSQYEAEKRVRQRREEQALREAEERAKEKKAQEERKLETERRKKEALEKREGRDRVGLERQAGERAVELLPDNVKEEFRNAVKSAAAGLKNGDQGGELRELAKLMSTLAAAVQNKTGRIDKQLSDLRQQIADLEGVAKNSRRR